MKTRQKKYSSEPMEVKRNAPIGRPVGDNTGGARAVAADRKRKQYEQAFKDRTVRNMREWTEIKNDPERLEEQKKKNKGLMARMRMEITGSRNMKEPIDYGTISDLAQGYVPLGELRHANARQKTRKVRNK